MNLEWVSLFSIIFCAMDVLMLGSFFSAMFPKRLNVIKYIICITTLMLLIMIENSFGSTWMNLFLMPVLYMLFAKLAFRISFSNSFGYTLIYYIIFAGGKEAAFEMLYRLVSAIMECSVSAWFMPGGISFLMVEYLFSYLYLLYIVKYLKRLNIREDDKFCWYLLIMPIASLLIMISFAYMEFPSSRMIQILMCLGTFLLYFSNGAIFVVLSRLTQAMNQVKLAELSDLKQDLERRNFDRVEKANAMYREFLHDIHHYFSQFRSLAAQGETQRIIGIVDELEGKLAAEEYHAFYIGDPVLNSILIEYERQAKEQGIEITIHAEEGLNVGFISDGDKISMFGNLLSNAVEAAERCSPGKRCMDVRLFMGNKYMLMFHVTNSHTNQFKMENTRLLSTKPDAGNHGLGIRIVKELAVKYGGMLTLSQDETYFSAVLTISRRAGQNELG